MDGSGVDLREEIGRAFRSIRRLGLGPALALLRQRERDRPAARALRRELQGRLCRDDPRAPYPGAGDLLEAIRFHGQEPCLRARDEALALLEELWRKEADG